MHRRVLGARDSLVAAPVGLRVAQATTSGPVDLTELAAMVSLLVDSGGCLVDVTGCTGRGDAARVIGSRLRGARERVVLTARDTEHIEGPSALDTTLRTLGTDHLDLWLIDPRQPGPPIERRTEALARAVADGRLRHIGLVGARAPDLLRADAVHPVTVAAAGYSLLERSVEQSLLPTARSLGVGVVAYRPLAMGLLHGAIAASETLEPTGSRRRPADPPGDHPRVGRDCLEHARVVARGLHRLAARRNLSAVRLALAWLLETGDDIVVLPATSSLTHLEMNLAAADVALSRDEWAELAAMSMTRRELS